MSVCFFWGWWALLCFERRHREGVERARGCGRKWVVLPLVPIHKFAQRLSLSSLFFSLPSLPSLPRSLCLCCVSFLLHSTKTRIHVHSCRALSCREVLRLHVGKSPDRDTVCITPTLTCLCPADTRMGIPFPPMRTPQVTSLACPDKPFISLHH